MNTGLDAMLVALAVLESALDAKGPKAAFEVVHGDLEVLDHATLARVAAAIVVESTWVMPPRTMRRAVRERVQRRRLTLMVNGL